MPRFPPTAANLTPSAEQAMVDTPPNIGCVKTTFHVAPEFVEANTKPGLLTLPKPPHPKILAPSAEQATEFQFVLGELPKTLQDRPEFPEADKWLLAGATTSLTPLEEEATGPHLMATLLETQVLPALVET